MNHPLKNILSVVLLSGFAWGMSPAAADLLTFTDQASWEAALAGPATVETFEGATSDVLFGLSSNATTSPNGDLALSANANFNDNASIDVSPYISSGAGINGNVVINMRFLDKGNGSNAQETLTVGLPSGISAFAFEYNNYDTQGDGTFLSFAGTHGGVVAAFDSTVDGFFGVVDTGAGATITSFSFTGDPAIGTGVSAFNSFDDVRYGAAAIPEPVSCLVPSVALFGVCLRRRRR